MRPVLSASGNNHPLPTNDMCIIADLLEKTPNTIQLLLNEVLRPGHGLAQLLDALLRLIMHT